MFCLKSQERQVPPPKKKSDRWSFQLCLLKFKKLSIIIRANLRKTVRYKSKTTIIIFFLLISGLPKLETSSATLHNKYQRISPLTSFFPSSIFQASLLPIHLLQHSPPHEYKTCCHHQSHRRRPDPAIRRVRRGAGLHGQ